MEEQTIYEKIKILDGKIAGYQDAINEIDEKIGNLRGKKNLFREYMADALDRQSHLLNEAQNEL